jgi:hypothetical protein
MRKIVSKHEEERRKRRNQFIVGGVLIVVMLVSVLGYAFQGQAINPSGSSNITSTYNGITFTNQNGFWSVFYKNQQLDFTYNPSQVNSDLTNLTKTINDFANKPLYIYSEDNNAQSEASINLAKFANGIITLQNLSEKDCSNNEIIIQNDSKSSIKQEQNCIIISGGGQDLIASVDNVLFKIFGIKS